MPPGARQGAQQRRGGCGESSFAWASLVAVSSTARDSIVTVSSIARDSPASDSPASDSPASAGPRLRVSLTSTTAAATRASRWQASEPARTPPTPAGFGRLGRRAGRPLSRASPRLPARQALSRREGVHLDGCFHARKPPRDGGLS